MIPQKNIKKVLLTRILWYLQKPIKYSFYDEQVIEMTVSYTLYNVL